MRPLLSLRTLVVLCFVVASSCSKCGSSTETQPANPGAGAPTDTKFAKPDREEKTVADKDRPQRTSKLGPYTLAIPDGFAVLDSSDEALLLRSLTDLTVTMRVIHLSDPSSEGKFVAKFLSEAEADLRKVEGANVRRVASGLKDGGIQLFGVVSDDIDKGVSPPQPERREMWVFERGSYLLAFSYIYYTKDTQAVDEVDRIQRALSDAVSRGPAQ